MKDKPTIDLYEAASILGMSAEGLARLARAGEIPGAKIGRAWVFLRSDIIDYAEKRIRAATAARKLIAVATQHKTITGRSRRALPQLFS